MRPSLHAVDAGYPRKPKYDRAELFRSIGWEDLINNGNYENTCAIRVSIALISAHMRIPGRMSIKKGALKGALIEPGQGALSHILTKRRYLGTPEKFKGESAARKGIGSRGGIVSFWNIHPYMTATQGHIDVVSMYGNDYLSCAGTCYFSASEVWFWALK
jgi:hypothetical protein